MAKFRADICSTDESGEYPYLIRPQEVVSRPSLQRATRDLYLDSISNAWTSDDAEKASIHKRVQRSQPVTVHKFGAALSGDFGTECIFERVWIYPLIVGGSFITEQQDINVIVWNAFQYRKVTITDILGTDTDGTILTHDTPPVTMQIWAEKNYALTLLKEGPPVQNTTYVFTIDGVEYTMEITGIRVIPVAPDPNWKAGIRMRYEFETAIYQTSRFYEQRRSLVDKSWRAVSLTYNLDNRDKEKFFHQSVYGHDKVFGVPIYHEKLYPTSLPQGGTTITFSNATDNMWNLLNRTAFIIIVDHESFLAEIKSIDQITSGQITLDNPIVESFNANSTYVYPCAFALIDSIKLNQETDGVDSIAIDFREFDSG